MEPPPPSRKSSDTVPSTLLLFGGGGAEVVDAAGFDVVVLPLLPRLVPVVVVWAGVCRMIAWAAAAAATWWAEIQATWFSKGQPL